jgi:hypothetical protein
MTIHGEINSIQTNQQMIPWADEITTPNPVLLYMVGWVFYLL